MEGREILLLTMVGVDNSKHNGAGDGRVTRRRSMVGAAEIIQYCGLW